MSPVLRAQFDADDRPPARLSQAERRARSRTALLESAARGLSRYGYANLRLEQVARDAGYTRGALYHQFKDKQDLTLAVARTWWRETWRQDVLPLVEAESEPAAALLALARGHAVFCRREVARVPIALRLEFTGQDHPVGREVERNYGLLLKHCRKLIKAGHAAETIPAGAPDRMLALAVVGALEGTVISVAGRAPYDEQLAERAVAGVLGIEPRTEENDR
ncbi:TetR/AcrR family transcriptional regulator [Solicola gregarius]|uniref:TetR/AcrR family transcriptional regulator n=1 Tax=Solicola gregarius TaxID=2908642 RepID=A0AA46TLE9_9ACTN|nr:TetR/AcrR family transcriptional regulator [Solicola gregarius]UYM07431.1 TetR/AcrR family transcriptional regulator [Solicola gregarius]